ncbi:hypothetical protein EHQ61_07255 [Leptospira wolffii]|uniref:hypothetical protein n=1 Tax=Leptospira wolffii TaxID=409998 RepID=UPI001084594B|nr:hypothetical protein [Leptospira wolffii]TGL52003.1 hypothetical protein EHQ61_07255 [Leptospira wolffii]
MVLLAVIGVLFLIFYLVFPFILNSRIAELSERVRELEKKLEEQGQDSKAVSKSPSPQSPAPKIPEKPIQVKEELPKPSKDAPKSPKKEPVPKVSSPAPVPQPTPVIQRSPVWEKWERQIADNWTGILGTVILTMGVGFLGIYAALKMSAFFRFLLVLGIGAALFAASILLVRKDFWKQIGYWVRSGSGAVILFACVGSIAIPGMKWIENEWLGLSIILFGISINLSLAWFASLQRFASLHIVLSLIALGILPLSSLIFGLAVAITVFSLILSYKAKWEYHLLVSVLSFLIFNLLYKGHFSQSDLEVGMGQSRWIGVFSTVTIGITALLVHYRKIYGSEKLEGLPFITHLVSWGSTALGLALYATGSKWNPPILLLSSIAVYFIARTARKKGIRWLYLTDTLVSLGIAFTGILLLGRWEFDSYSISILSSILFLIFFIISVEEKETVLKNCGAVFLHLSWFSYLILLFFRKVQGDNLGEVSRTIETLGMVVMAFAAQIYDSLRHKNEKQACDDIYGLTGEFRVSPAGIFIGLFSSAFCFQTLEWKYSEIFLPLYGIGLLYIRQNRNWNGLGIGILPFVLSIHLCIIGRIQNLEALEVLGRDLPLLGFCFFSSFFSKFKTNSGKTAFYSWPGSALFSLHLLVLAYWVTNSFSPFLPGIIWLMLSLFYLELVTLTGEKKEEWALNWKQFLIPSQGVFYIFSLGFVGFFLGAHFLMHLQSESSFGFFKIRFLIQIFAVACFLYWATNKAVPSEENSLWRKILPLFWELIVIFITIIIALEVPNNWLAVSWILWAFLLDTIGLKYQNIISRFRFYSLLFFWYSCIYVAFVSSSTISPSVLWKDQEWLGGLVSIVLQTAYLFRAYFLPPHQGGESEGFPLSVVELAKKMENHFNTAIFYPLFAAVAFFLFWSFDSSLLTLLWMIEIFFVFLIGLALKESHFRYVSLGAMVICLGRLIFWDLAQSSTITRALVFLGVGGILILMNTIYGKYRSKEKENVQ